MTSKLSPRELSVIELAVRGFTDEMIARELGIESGTVNSYWVRIRGKLGNFSRTELAARFVQTSADGLLADERERAEHEAEASQRALTDANAEIERLKGLLKAQSRAK